LKTCNIAHSVVHSCERAAASVSGMRDGCSRHVGGQIWLSEPISEAHALDRAIAVAAKKAWASMEQAAAVCQVNRRKIC
jgi:hypothetical protein